MYIKVKSDLILNVARFSGEMSEERRQAIITEIERKLNQIQGMECDAVGGEMVGVRIHAKEEIRNDGMQ